MVSLPFFSLQVYLMAGCMLHHVHTVLKLQPRVMTDLVHYGGGTAATAYMPFADL
jgi:hypothetical protein